MHERARAAAEQGTQGPADSDLFEAGGPGSQDFDGPESGVVDDEDGQWIEVDGQRFSTEGSVTTEDGRFITYPDGFTVRFVSAEDLQDNSLGFEIPLDHTLVKITLSLENKGDSPVLFNGNNTFMDVFYGVSRFQAEVQGYAGDQRTLQDPAPTRVSPGTTQIVYRTFSIPNAELGEIVVSHNIGEGMYTPYTFVDVGKILTSA